MLARILPKTRDLEALTRLTKLEPPSKSGADAIRRLAALIADDAEGLARSSNSRMPIASVWWR